MASPKARPTHADFATGWATYLNLIEILKPCVCIKFAYAGIGQLGGYLNTHDTDWKSNVKEFFNKEKFVIHLTKGDYTLKNIFVHHPTGARGYKYEKWAELIRSEY